MLQVTCSIDEEGKTIKLGICPLTTRISAGFLRLNVALPSAHESARNTRNLSSEQSKGHRQQLQSS